VLVEFNEGQEVFHEVRLAVLNLPVIPQYFQHGVAVIEEPRFRLAVRSCNRQLILDAVTAEYRLDSDMNLTTETYTFKVYLIVASVPLVDEIAV
jgi:hypothetical protein